MKRGENRYEQGKKRFQKLCLSYLGYYNLHSNDHGLFHYYLRGINEAFRF